MLADHLLAIPKGGSHPGRWLGNLPMLHLMMPLDQVCA